MHHVSLGTCVLYAALAGFFTWGVTALGAALVLLTRRFSSRSLDCMLGFGAGVMLASSFWSLLLPGLDQAEALAMNGWLTAALGLLCGAAAVYLGGRLCRRLNLARHAGSSARRCQLLIGAITLHNIPEGMAVGVAFGALAGGGGAAALSGACMLALGIGLQNFPEGAAISLPLRREGMSRGRAFFFGQFSGFVEPVSAVLGALLAATLCQALPFLLCFAAGAMLWVILTEMVPESQSSAARVPAAWWIILGFCLMTILDVALG